MVTGKAEVIRELDSCSWGIRMGFVRLKKRHNGILIGRHDNKSSKIQENIRLGSE